MQHDSEANLNMFPNDRATTLQAN